MPGAKFLVGGIVQGVFFRASTREQALRLKLDGHAKNLADGRVEVVARGDAAALQELEFWLRHGPQQARIDRLEREDIDEPADIAAGFRTL